MFIFLESQAEEEEWKLSSDQGGATLELNEVDCALR